MDEPSKGNLEMVVSLARMIESLSRLVANNADTLGTVLQTGHTNSNLCLQILKLLRQNGLAALDDDQMKVIERFVEQQRAYLPVYEQGLESLKRTIEELTRAVAKLGAGPESLPGSELTN